MKKILTLTLICATINLLAQNNTSPFPMSGNVGIGTVNPIHAIHIVRPTNSVSSIGLEQSGINMWRLGMAANSPDLRFSANNDGLTNSVFTIQQGGNIGVGTLNPLTKLYVDGDIGVPSFKKIKVGYYLNIQEHIKLENEFDRALIAQGLAWDNENNRYDLTSNSPYNRNGIILGNGGIKFFSHQGNVSSSPFWSQAELNNKVHLFVSNTGQVGIGTLSPQYGSLEIFQSSADDGGDKSYLSLHRGGQIDWQLGLKNNSFTIASGGGAGRTSLWETKHLTIYPSGQVLIGTTTPYSDYKLSVAGNVIADKVKVKKSTNGVWPDFVFSPTYNLLTLTEVERFVKQNRHLPEIPSASEIEKDGQDLGEMNRLLLKKVEELTLYLIEINKKYEKQSNIIEKQEIEITQIKKQLDK